MRYAFAGDRDIAVAVLDFLLGEAMRPEALLLSGPERASHAEALETRCGHLDSTRIFRGAEFREEPARRTLEALELDFLVCVHFPYIVPRAVLDIPRLGAINLHPAFLPFNRGWHTPSWAILEDTPIGGTLHFMDEGLDTGPIIHQRSLVPAPGDTGDTLYRRTKALELEVFREAWPLLVSGEYTLTDQREDEGTAHRRKELLTPAVQKVDLDAPATARAVLRQLRALTTGRLEEAAYFEEGERRYRVQVTITEEPID